MTYPSRIYQSDVIGALAGSFCLVHCCATPFLFFVKACSSTCCADSPIWWQAIDYVFIVISFIAILFVSKSTTQKWISLALWANWFLLLITILDGTLKTGWIPDLFIHLPSLGIIGLHLYNLKYCMCSKEACCVNN